MNIITPQETDFKTRVAAVADLYQSRKAAAHAAGVGVSTLSRWIAGEGMPAFNSLAALAEPKGVSLDWVATGKGVMRRPGAAGWEDDFCYIPLFDEVIAEKSPHWRDGARVLRMIPVPAMSFIERGLEANSILALSIHGDYDAPLYCDGDTVFVDHNRNSYQGPALYAIRVHDLLHVRRLERGLDLNFSVIPANTAYQTQIVPACNMEIMGRVVWAGRWWV